MSRYVDNHTWTTTSLQLWCGADVDKRHDMAMTLQMFQRSLNEWNWNLGLFVAEPFTAAAAKTNQYLCFSTRIGRRSIPQLDIAIVTTLYCKLLNPSQPPQQVRSQEKLVSSFFKCDFSPFVLELYLRFGF